MGAGAAEGGRESYPLPAATLPLPWQIQAATAAVWWSAESPEEPNMIPAVAMPATGVVEAVFRQACPRCGLLLPLPHRVRAALLCCPETACAARLRVRAGRVLPA
jgi:hypothetical protein